MKKRRVVFVCIMAVVLVLGVPTWWYLSSSRKVVSSFTPCATGMVADGVFSIRDDFVNVFAVRAGDSYIVLDGGANAKSVAAGFDELGIDPDKVVAVFLTHSDYDHVAAVSRFKNARVYLSDREIDMVTGKVRRAFVFSNHVGFAYSALSDGSVTQVGNRSVRTIITPGHTVGSACYVVDGSYLFTGDTVSVKNGKLETFDAFFNMDTKLQANSIGKISSLKGLKMILTAHYGVAKNVDELFADWNRR